VTAGASGGVTQLRDRMARRLRELDPAEVVAASDAVSTRVIELLERREPGALAAYWPTGGEVDPGRATDRLAADGWSVWLPVVPGGAPAPMSFRQWDRPEAPPPGRYGIPTPPAGSPETTADGLSVALVPLVLFGPGGQRAGRGAGYYDRTFAARGGDGPPPLLVGLAHDFQEVGAWPANPWDVPLDVVVTPTRTLVR
jgi:5-formyltetrahydrofolate cyclo-ligase